MNRLKTVSLFSGCGGLDLGFEAAGFDIHFMADILPEAAETLRYNHPNAFIFGPNKYSGDIADLSKDFIYSNRKVLEGGVDMIIGGPPCQPFSVAAAQRFLKQDNRFKRTGFTKEKVQLIFEYLRLIQELMPKAFLIENVPGIIKIDNGETVRDLKQVLESLGYIVSVQILQAADFGVPQFRSRAFIIGNRLGQKFKFPAITHGDGLFLKPFVTSGQALANLGSEITNHETRDHKPESVLRYKTLRFGEREKLGREDRLDPYKPSKTVIAGGSSGGGRSHLHPFLARTLSVRESARLQTFPDDYKILGKTARQFTQVGNAVPPLLGEVLAREIQRQFFGESFSNKKLAYQLNYPSIQDAIDDLYKSSKNSTKYFLYSDTETAYKIKHDE